jgi:hypothetical protein
MQTNRLPLVYIQSELLYVSANHVAFSREVKYREWYMNVYQIKITELSETILRYKILLKYYFNLFFVLYVCIGFDPSVISFYTLFVSILCILPP